jgi:hypothetical protein
MQEMSKPSQTAAPWQRVRERMVMQSKWFWIGLLGWLLQLIAVAALSVTFSYWFALLYIPIPLTVTPLAKWAARKSTEDKS